MQPHQQPLGGNSGQPVATATALLPSIATTVVRGIFGCGECDSAGKAVVAAMSQSWLGTVRPLSADGKLDGNIG